MAAAVAALQVTEKKKRLKRMKDLENEYEYERREKRTEVACCVSGVCMTEKKIEGSEDRKDRTRRRRRRRWKIEAGIASESGLKERSRFCSSFVRFLFRERLCDFRKRTLE